MWLSSRAQINQRLCVLLITHSAFLSRGFCVTPPFPVLHSSITPPPNINPRHDIIYGGRTLSWNIRKVKESNGMDRETVAGGCFVQGLESGCVCVQTVTSDILKERYFPLVTIGEFYVVFSSFKWIRWLYFPPLCHLVLFLLISCLSLSHPMCVLWSACICIA